MTVHPLILQAVESVTRELHDFERAASVLAERFAPSPVILVYDNEGDVGPEWDLRWESTGRGYGFVATIDGRKAPLASWPVWFRLLVCECSCTKRQPLLDMAFAIVRSCLANIDRANELLIDGVAPRILAPSAELLARYTRHAEVENALDERADLALLCDAWGRFDDLPLQGMWRFYMDLLSDVTEEGRAT